MKRLVAWLAVASAILLMACGSTSYGVSQPGKGPIVVSSKADTEGALLGQVIAQMLRANGFQVTESPAITGTPLIRKAILSGEVDIYPEYTGNGAFFFEGTDPEVWKDAKKGFDLVKRLDREKNKLVWLRPAPANNTWAIAIPRKLADSEKLRSLDDFAAYVKRGGNVKLIGSAEFITSPAALPAFSKAYGFTLRQDQLVSLSGGNTAITEKAAAEGTDGVNAAMAYGTDGGLAALNLVVLTDPRGAQPVYEPAPLVRAEIYERYPELSSILDPVFESLTMETLQTLNGKIASQGQKASDVAREYLVSKRFLK